MCAQPSGSDLWNERWHEMPRRTLGSALYMAAGCNDLQRLRGLLDRGAPTEWRNEQGETPLYIACMHGYVEAVELLCAWGADLDQKVGGRTPLIAACHNGRTPSHAEVAACLLAFGADPTVSQGGASALTRAEEGGHATCVALLENACLTTTDEQRSVGRVLVDDTWGGRRGDREEKRRGARLASIVREARGGRPTLPPR